MDVVSDLDYASTPLRASWRLDKGSFPSLYCIQYGAAVGGMHPTPGGIGGHWALCGGGLEACTTAAAYTLGPRTSDLALPMDPQQKDKGTLNVTVRFALQSPLLTGPLA